MEARIILPIRLHSLNEYIKACREYALSGAAMKRQDEWTVSWNIDQRLSGVHFSRPVIMDYTWVEKNMRRDKDNISSYGRKVIQDALVTCGVLDGDGWNEIEGFSDRFAIDKKNPRIEVTIREVEDGRVHQTIQEDDRLGVVPEQ